MTGPVLADRVCKARRASTCPLCRGPVRVGHLIARMGPGCWVHAACLTARNREDDMEPFTIRNAQGGDMITVRRDGPNVTLAVRPRHPGDPVTISPDEAGQLAAALTRRWPMIGEPTPDALGRDRKC